MLQRFLAVTLILLCGCVPQIPQDALRLSPESLALRQLQTRRYETQDEKSILVAAAALLQDLGFSLDESETALGLIVASKERDAQEAGQIVTSIVIGALTETDIPWDVTQKIRVSVVTKRLGPKDVSCRVTFQRIVWDNRGQVSKLEGIGDPLLYQQFFEGLSKSVFLEAHQI